MNFSQQEMIALSYLIKYCAKFGVSEKIAKRLFEYGDGVDTLDGLKDDPFGYIQSVPLYTIKHAELLGTHIPADDIRRLRAYLLVSLNDVLGDARQYRNNQGDTYVRLSQLRQAFRQRFGEHDFEQCLNASGAIVDGEIVTSRLLYEAEMTIAEWLVEAKRIDEEANTTDLFSAVLERLEGTRYSQEQRLAIANSVTRRVSVLTGSAGTGKTQTVLGIVGATPRTMLLAPTGAAAKRLTFLAQKQAYTIHLAVLSPLLEEELATAKLIVIDELSMADVIILARLLRKLQEVNPDVRLAFVGDEHQLKSVQPGAVLRDICATKNVVPIQRLTKNFRQGAGSVIVDNANKIWQGKTDLAQVEGQFEIVEVSDMVDMWQILKAEPPSLSNAIISAQNRSFGWGVDPLNFLCQYWHNPKGEEVEYNTWRNQGDIVILNEDIKGRRCQFFEGEAGRITSHDYRAKKITLDFDGAQMTLPTADFERKTTYRKVFRPGDVVMHLENTRENGLVNGDIGTVLTVSPNTVTVDWQEGQSTRMVTVKRDKKSKEFPLSLAFVYTCNKMQGSEREGVTVLVTKSFYEGLVNRDWLATAITRGRSFVRIIHDGCLNRVIKRKAKERKTRLVEFIERLI